MRTLALAVVFGVLAGTSARAQDLSAPPPPPILDPLPAPPPVLEPVLPPPPPLAREEVQVEPALAPVMPVPVPSPPSAPPASADAPVAAPAVPGPPPPTSGDPAAAAPKKEECGPGEEKKECESGSPESISTPPASPGFGFSGATPALGELTRPMAPGIGLGMGIEKIDRDLYLLTTATGTFDLGPVHLGIQAPLRWRIWNLDDQKPLFQLRKQDWDEVSDYFRILRYVEYGSPKQTVYARAGELAGTTLGHGTIVSWYYNAIDVDHWQTGLRFNLNLNPGGLETMLQSVTSPRLAGGRLYVRPWYFVDKCSLLYRLAVGLSTYVDADAPTTMAGSTVDEHQNLVAPTKTLAVYGLDLEYPILASELVDLTPYVDLNIIGGQGVGFHGGVLLGLHPPVVDLQARLEYRALGARYLPAYFNSLYEVQRFQYQGGKTKLQWLEEGGHGEAVNGAYGELVVSVGKHFSLLGSYEDYEGPHNGALQLRLLLPEVAGLRLGAYYFKQNIEAPKEIFTSRHNAMGVLELRYQITPIFSVLGQVARQWQLGADGRYEAIDTYHFGFQAGWTF
ncbi:MAG: hypothetical protein HY901_02435 [Deltaproteobacteria bacterium]|nr:hypothetical protein [Deltaproteobacteria bacterium]